MNVLILYPEQVGFRQKSSGTSVIAGLVRGLGHIVEFFDTSMYDQRRIEEDAKSSLIHGGPISWFPRSRSAVKPPPTLTVDVIDAFNEKLSSFSPEIILVSATYLSFARGRRLIEVSDAKKALVVYGGVHCTTAPEMAISPASVKYIHIGEGDASLPILLGNVEKGLPLDDCPNIWAKQKDGSLKKNAQMPLVRNLDATAFYNWDIYSDYHFFRVYQGRVFRMGDYMLSRGCVNHCSYCFNKDFFAAYDANHTVRSYSVDRAIEELVMLKEKHHIDFIKFQDSDLLNKSETYMREFAVKYARYVGLPNTGGACVGSVTSAKIRSLVSMNTLSLAVGVESGNERIRREVLHRPDYSNSRLIEKCRELERFGVRVTLAVMIGLPDETRSEIFDTIRLCKETGVEHADIGLFFPFPNLTLTNYAIKKGYLKGNAATGVPFGAEALLSLEIPTDELMAVLRCAMLYVRLPKLLWPLIRQAELDTDGALWRFLRLLFFLRLSPLAVSRHMREFRRRRNRRMFIAQSKPEVLSAPKSASIACAERNPADER